MYNTYERGKHVEVEFEKLKGKTLTGVSNTGDDIVFTTSDGETYRQVYYDDCCASCSVEEIHGDLNDLLGSPILMAEEVSSSEPSAEVQAERDKHAYYHESETWTFYKLATIKGSVTIRWYGSSNGYYSEEPTFEQVLE